MIKRFAFASRPPDQDPARFAADLHHGATVAMGAPPAARPVRVAVCLALTGVLPRQAHDGVVTAWFAQPEALERFDDWGATAHGDALVVADEVVGRGGDWLERRWKAGGPAVKHMALARRAEGLGRAEFSQRWRQRAGRVGTEVIPDAVRGLAYVQNHPRPHDGRDWAYDAVNEVYFDGLDGLRARIEWFAANVGDRPEDDLVGQPRFLAVTEEPVP